VDVRVTIREEPSGKWVASSEGEARAIASGATMERCLANLRRALDRSSRGDTPVTLVVQVAPRLAGVAEAAGIIGWDKRRVITYIDRGSFPEPLQSLASGRVWFASDIARFKGEWVARRARLARKGKRGS
jgi:hypothetical protein